MSKQIRQTVVGFLRANKQPLLYILAIGVMTWVVWKNWAPASGYGLEQVWQKHVVHGEPIHYQYLLLAVAVCSCSITMTLIRWYVLVRAQDLPISLPNAFRLGLVGMFFNTFLPGSVGGDIIKAAFLAREQNRRTVAVATVILDRAIALWGLICFVAMLGSGFWILGMLDNAVSKDIVLGAIGLVGASLLVWAILGLLPEHRAERFAGRLGRLPRVGHAAAEFWRAVWLYRCQKKSIALALVLSWIGHVGFVLTFYFCVLTLWDAESGQQIPTTIEHFLIVPIGLVIQAVPFSPGGAGFGELGFGFLYEILGCSVVAGVMGSLVQRVLLWVLGGVGFLVYLKMRPTLQAATAEMAQQESVGADLKETAANGPPRNASVPEGPASPKVAALVAAEAKAESA